jgi:hypothetical protein
MTVFAPCKCRTDRLVCQSRYLCTHQTIKPFSRIFSEALICAWASPSGRPPA